MIVKCQNQEVIEKYIDNDYYKCLYLYLDLKQYGVCSESIDVYCQIERGKIEAVYLRYYKCLHVYSRENTFNLHDFFAFFDVADYSMIYCEKTTAQYIWNEDFGFLKKSFDINYGWVARIQQVAPAVQADINNAKDDDFPQIVALIHEDEDIGRSYDIEELSKQLKERALEGYTRNYVIRKGKKVIAHACTNAELDEIAVVAELVVDKAYRRQGYATAIWSFICKELVNEKKEVYSFYYSAESRLLHKKTGFEEVCQWAKIVKRD